MGKKETSAKTAKIVNNILFGVGGVLLFVGLWSLATAGTDWEPAAVFGLTGKGGSSSTITPANIFKYIPEPGPIKADALPKIFKEETPVIRPTRIPPTKRPTLAPTRPPTQPPPSDSIAILMRKGEALFKSERFIEAERLFKKCSDKRKSYTKRFAKKFYTQGMRYLHRKRWGSAAELFKIALHFDFTDPAIHDGMVGACVKLKAWKRVKYHKAKAKAFRKKRRHGG